MSPWSLVTEQRKEVCQSSGGGGGGGGGEYCCLSKAPNDGRAGLSPDLPQLC